MLLLDQASLHMSGCRLWNSTANRDGGAVEAEGQSRILADTSTFIGNNAGGSGAALYMMENQVGRGMHAAEPFHHVGQCMANAIYTIICNKTYNNNNNKNNKYNMFLYAIGCIRNTKIQ